jgi:hypothetical protein
MYREPPVTDFAGLIDAVTALTASIEGLRGDLQDHFPRSIPPRLNGTTDRALAALLRAIVAWNGGNGVIFSMSMLLDKCAQDAELHAAVLACVRSLSTKKLGQLFAANKGCHIDGLTIERTKRLWSVRKS